MQKIDIFKDNVDAWIKQIRLEISELRNLYFDVKENQNNIQHNYELIQELRDETEKIKKEINSLKLIQIITLKKK